jgi:four helix bundle protein
MLRLHILIDFPVPLIKEPEYQNHYRHKQYGTRPGNKPLKETVHITSFFHPYLLPVACSCIFTLMNITLEKSRTFAIRIYNLYKHLCDEKHEYTLAKQLLRSGTSIGANLTEAQYSISRKEFLAKAQISLKECAETEYWLDLLRETGLITLNEYESIINDNKELLRLLTSITKTLKTNSK